jgi:SAM-dependent methyltransferase
MGHETAKANNYRRKHDPFFQRIFRGKALDIGAGSDLLTRQGHFPDCQCESFDLGDGNAEEILRYKQPQSYDLVYSSHCLEDLRDPGEALRQWYQLVKPGGFLVVVVPDEDLYEQGVFPSRFNPAHKWTFSIYKMQGESWSPRHINLFDLIRECIPQAQILRIGLYDTHYDYTKSQVDQTAAHPGAEAHIECVLKKPGEINETPQNQGLGD